MSSTRSRKKRSKKPRTATPAARPELLTTPLEGWAGEDLARVGRRSALLGRVESLRLVSEGRGLEAYVGDVGPNPHHVSIRVRSGVLKSRCTCAQDDGKPCKHAVAAVEALRFPRPVVQPKSNSRRAGRTARGRGRVLHQPPRPTGWVLTSEERTSLALEEEFQNRRRRARKEQAPVKRLSGRGGPPRFQIGGSEPEAPYTVVLRGARADLGSCTCPDFAKNELATCKHVERVRNWFSRKRKRLPKNVLSLWWRPRPWPRAVPDVAREIRFDGPEGSTEGILTEYFDREGWLLPAPACFSPSGWVRRAVEAARDLSSQRGWHWDLDPRVDRRVGRLREEETRAVLLSQVEKGGAIWERVVPHLSLKLHPYQEAGVFLLARCGRAFLADDMGLGKSVQAVAAALLLRHAVDVRRVLVVCPASLKHQWRREIDKACGEEAEVLEVNQVARLDAYRRWKQGFLVINYELVLRDLEAIRKAAPNLVILDEAQRIKNWETKTAKAVKRLDSPFAFILTGTPLENRLVELHSLVEFLHPRALGPRWRLFPFHAVTDPDGRVLAYEGLDVLRKRLEGFFLRRERDEVLDQLPARTDNTFWTEMTHVQRRAYRREASRVAKLLSRNQPLNSQEVRVLLQQLTTMRILCNAYAQYAWTDYADRLADPTPAAPTESRLLHSPKLEEFARVLEDLLDESESKIVVFSQWERMLRLAHFTVRELLLRREERADVFHGGLDGRARRRVLERFREDPEFRVLFSTDAGGLGLNLQDSASIVVNLEVPWNPAVLEQRIGRVHRMGQRRNVRVLHFVTKGAIEERVRHVLEMKKALFDGLLVDEVDRVVIDPASQSSILEKVRRLVDDDNGP